MAAKKCLICNNPLHGRADAKTCSDRCRKRLQMLRVSFETPGYQSPKPTRKHFSKVIASVILGIFSLLALLLSSNATKVQAAASTYLNFQARLLTSTGAVVPDGNYNIDFKIYTADSTTGSVGTCTGSCVWEETHKNFNSQGVRVVNGYFSVSLGSITAFGALNWDQQLWLTMNIGGTTTGSSPTWDGEMQNSGHSIQLTAVPLAFAANQLATGTGTSRGTLSFAALGQATAITLPDPASGSATVCYQLASACGFESTSGTDFIKNQTSLQSSSNFHISGTGNADTSFTSPSIDAQSGGSLAIGNNNATAINIGKTGSNILTTVYGTALFKPTTGNDSTTAFQIQNAAGNQIFNANTTTTDISTSLGNLVLNGATPPTPTLSSTGTGGTLAAGTYYYRLAGITPSGRTYATPSSPASVTTSGSTSKNTLNWTAMTGATGYYIYRSTTGNAPWYRNTLGLVTTAVDDGTNFTWSGTDYQSDGTGSNVGSIELKEGSNLFLNAAHTAELNVNPSNGELVLGNYASGGGVVMDGNSFLFEDTTGYNPNLYIDNTGATTFKNRVNSTTAFQVQNSSSTTLLNVNTLTLANLNQIPNANLEKNINGWSAKGSATVSFDYNTGNADFGSGDLKTVTTAAITDGAKYNFPLLPSTQYSFSVYAKADSSINAILGRQENGSDVETGCSGFTITTSYQQFTCTFTTGATINTVSNIYLRQTTAAVHTIYIDGVTLVAGATVQNFVASASLLNLQGGSGNVNLNDSNTGELQAWQLNTPGLGSSLSPLNRADGGTAIFNGYIYYVAGYTGGTAASDVYYAKLNVDGSTSSWTVTTAVTTALTDAGIVASNGYLYVLGGCTTTCGNGTAVSTAYYAKINTDGTVGSWNSTTALTNTRRYLTAAAANGYIYSIGGNDGTDGTSAHYVNTVYYAKQMADGTLGSWSSANTITNNRGWHTSVIANGYLYVIGGHDGTSPQSTVYYAKLNSDGTLGSWNSTTGMPDVRYRASSVVANGYIYEIGGNSGSNQSQVWYAKVNGDGTLGSWSTGTNSLPDARTSAVATTANGYVYVLGGWTGAFSSVTSTVYYASTSRIQVGGSLDLVGLGGQQLGDVGGTGGSLTAADGIFVGSLQVQGDTSLASSLAVDKNLKVGGSVLFKNAANSTTAFQVQNSSGSTLLAADTANLKVSVTGDVNVGTRYGNRLFSDNFESGTFSLWSSGTSGSPTIDSTTPHDGKYAAKFNPASSSTYATTSLAGNSTVYARMWIDVTSASSQLDTMILKQGTAQSFVVYRSSPGNQACIWNNVTSASVGCGGSWTTSTWHLIEIRITTGNPTGTSQLWFDGTQVVNATSQNNGTANIDGLIIGETDTIRTGTYFIDDVSADTSTNGTASSLNVDDSFHVGGTSSFGNGVLIQPASDSSRVFQVLDSSGNNYLRVDTTATSRIVLNATNTVFAATGVAAPSSPANTVDAYQVSLGVEGTVGNIQLQSTGNAIGFSRNSANYIQATSSGGYFDFVVNGASASDANAALKLGSDGSALFKNGTNSTTGFQIQNASGTAAVTAATVLASNLITNGDLETNVTGWTALGSAGAPTQTTSQHYLNTAALSETTTTAAGDGVKYPVSLSSTTTYTLSFFAKLDSGSPAFTTFEFGRSDDGSTNTACSNSQTVSATMTTTWTNFSCTFTTGTTSGSPYIYMRQTDAGNARTFYIDAVELKVGNVAGSYGTTALTVAGDVITKGPQADVRAFGAKGDGTTDDTAAIQAAIDSLGSTGGVVLIPTGLYKVTSTLNVLYSGITIQGQGQIGAIFGGAFTTGTELRWGGSSNSTMLNIATTPGANNRALRNDKVYDLSIDCNQNSSTPASRGILVSTLYFGSFKNLHIRNCITAGLDLTASASPLLDPRGTIGNVFENITIRENDGGTTGCGTGSTNPCYDIRLSGDGTGTANVNTSTFTDIYVASLNGTAIQLNDSDNNSFNNVLVSHVACMPPGSPGCPYGIELNGGTTGSNGAARENYFNHIVVPGVVSRGTGFSQPATYNWINGMTMQNGSQAPVIEPGSILYYSTDDTQNMGNLGLQTASPSQVLDVNGNETIGTRGTEKVTNGTFDSSCSGWTLGGADWTCDSTNNQVTHAAGGTTTVSQNVSAVAGQTYAITFTVNNRTAGNIAPSIGGTAGTNVTFGGPNSTSVTTTQTLTAVNTGNLIFTPTSAFVGSLDNVSVKQLTGGNLYTFGKIGINTLSPAGNLDIRQLANGDTLFYGRRNTDSSPTGNFLQFQNNAGNATAFQVDINGNTTITSLNNSTTAFQVQNATNGSLFNVDTSASLLTIGGNLLPSTSPTQGLTSPVVTANVDGLGTAAGQYSRLALGSDGLPIIAYIDASTSKVRVTKCGNDSCSSGNTSTGSLSTNNASYLSIAVPSDGKPVIAYQDTTNTALNLIKCANTSCTSVTSDTQVDNSGGANPDGANNSVTIGNDGYPVISYAADQGPGNYLGLVHCTNAACTTHSTIQYVNFEVSGASGNTSITIGGDGFPFVVSAGSSGHLEVSHCTAADCSGTINSTDVVTNVTANYGSVTTGTDGYPIISFYDGTGGDLDVLKCTSYTCSGNVNGQTFVDGNGTNTGEFSSITIGGDGLPVIAYYYDIAGTQDLKVVKCGNTGCTSGNTITAIDTTNDVGQYSSIAVLSNGLPVMSYYQATATADLKVARCGSTNCATTSTSYSGGLNLGAPSNIFASLYAAGISTGSSGETFNLQTNNTTRLSIDSTGLTTFSGQSVFKNTTNSTTALQVQSSSGTNVFVVDTANLQNTVSSLQATGTISLQGADGGSILLRTSANSGTGANALIFSGNEITDKTRSTDTQGDGRAAPDSSTGVWGSSTNLVTNGGFESNTTGWTTSGTNTIAQDSTRSKFGTSSLKATYQNTAATLADYNITLTNAGYGYSAWIYIPGSYSGSQVQLKAVNFTSATGTLSVNANMSLRNQWQRVHTTFTPAAGDLVGDIVVGDSGTPTAGDVVYIDGVQVENTSLNDTKPYVETNGGTATRDVGRIQAPSTLINSTKGWAAFRVRYGIVGTSYNGGAFLLGTTGNDNVILYWNGTNWQISSSVGGLSDSININGGSPASGNYVTVVAGWDSTTLYLSLNGASFTTNPRTHGVPTVGANLDIGSLAGYLAGSRLNGDIMWTAMGTGALTSSDLAALYGLGNSDPTISGINSMDSTASPSIVWDGESTQYTGMNNTPTQQSGITIDDVSLTHSANGSLVIQGAVNSTTAFQIQNASSASLFSLDTSKEILTLAPYGAAYIGGGDISGTTNGGTSGDYINNQATVGRYEYVVKQASSGTCSTSSAIGCELQVWDVSNPSAPTYVGGADASGTTNGGSGSLELRDVMVSGRYAYTLGAASGTACNATAGNAIGCELKIWDISNPSAPTLVGGADSSGSLNGTGTQSYGWNMDISGTYLYLDESSGNAGTCSATVATGCEIQIWNIANPVSPKYIAGIDSQATINGGSSSDYVTTVRVHGNYLFTARNGDTAACSTSAGNGCELMVFNVTNPASPTYVGGGDVSGQTNTGTSTQNMGALDIYGRYIYIGLNGANSDTACSSTVGSGIGCDIQIWDVSNPAAPAYKGGIDATGSTNSGTGDGTTADSIIYSVATGGHYLYIGKAGVATACSATAGSAIGCEIQVYDINNPILPVYKGGADSSGLSNSGTGSGTNLTFNTVNGRYIYAVEGTGSATACSGSAGSAIGCELQTYDLGGLDANTVNANSLEAGVLQVDNSGSVLGNFTIKDSLTVGQSASIQGDLSVNGYALFQNKTNSTTAFQVQNAAGITEFAVDTTPLNSYLTNPSFESTDTSTWTASDTNSGGSAIRNTTYAYIGSASLTVITGTTAAAFDGVKGAIASTLSTSTQYTMSWYDFITTGTFTDVLGRFSYDGTTANAVSCTGMKTQVVSTNGWTRHDCQFTTGSAGTAPTSSNAIFIVQQGSNGGTQRTFYVDAVQLELSAPSTAYKESGITLNGVVNSPLAVKPQSNSTTAFSVQNTSGVQTLSVNTTDSDVSIVSQAPTIAALVVDKSGNDLAASIRLRDGANTRYRSDLNLITGGGLQVNAYDDTGAVYQPIELDASTVSLKNGTTEILKTQSTGVLIHGTTSTSAFQVQNSSNFTILGADTSGSQVLFGDPSHLSAKLVFYNSSNSNTITLSSGATAASTTVTLPATMPGGSVQQGASYVPFITNLTADSAASSSQTLANITASGNANDALSLTIPAGATVSFRVSLIWISSSSSNSIITGLVCSNTAQSTTSTSWIATTNAGIAQNGSTTACSTSSTTLANGGTTSIVTTPALAEIVGTIKANASSATTVTFQYARSSASTGNTTIKAGSYVQWWQ